MPLIVQKFGGTSVADAQKISAAARRAIRAQQDGNQVVMVVSAMGKNTDVLVDLAKQISDRPSAREMDMLLSTGEQVSVALMAMAIQALGHKAVSLTGAQIGIRTDSTHTKARIRSITTEKMQAFLDQGNIVIAAGFQGIDENFNITTLGRGGSDTTAVALAAVLGAHSCEIHTDVDGVYTTDPRQLPEARLVKQISYDEMLELASLGAGVMHSRSIEFAKKFNVPIHVRSSFTDQPGTMILSHTESPDQAVSGAALTREEARVTILDVPDQPGISYAIFSKIADRNITVDMIVQDIAEEGKADISFTVVQSDLADTLEVMQQVAHELGASGVTHDDQVAKLSVVGLGMARQTGIAQQMFQALAESGINIAIITTSEIKISVLISREQSQLALRSVHGKFALEKVPAQLSEDLLQERLLAASNDNSAIEVVRLLQQGMEDLTVESITLDETQARVTILNIPDQPGLAAQLFSRLAEAEIFVDMIVQSFGRAGKASISITVPQQSLERCTAIVEEVAQKLGCGPVSSSPRIAKLTITGIGMRSHTDVAIRIFQSLAEAGINIEMTNTSEVRMNVVVSGSHGKTALKALQEAFADAIHTHDVSRD